MLVAVNPPWIGPAVRDGAEVATREHEHGHHREQPVAEGRWDGPRAFGRLRPTPALRPQVAPPRGEHEDGYRDHEPIARRQAQKHHQCQREGSGEGYERGEAGGRWRSGERFPRSFGRPEQQVGCQSRQADQRRRGGTHGEGDARREEVGLRERDGGYQRNRERYGVGEPLGEVPRCQQASRPEPPGQNTDQERRGEDL